MAREDEVETVANYLDRNGLAGWAMQPFPATYRQMETYLGFHVTGPTLRAADQYNEEAFEELVGGYGKLVDDGWD